MAMARSGSESAASTPCLQNGADSSPETALPSSAIKENVRPWLDLVDRLRIRTLGTKEKELDLSQVAVMPLMGAQRSGKRCPLALASLLRLVGVLLLLSLAALTAASTMGHVQDVPPPPKSAPWTSLWCPQYHEIQGHYDPSGPILVDGTWHVFPDGSTAPGKGWSHFTSKDLLRWQRQANSTVAGGDTGSVSLTENGDVVALFPDNDPKNGERALFRQTPTADGGAGKLGLNVQWSRPTVGVDKPSSLGKGMRDPARALKMPDGHWYVGAGSGFGGTGPKSNNNTGVPSSGTGCLAWFRAKDATLSAFDYVGCLLENNHTTGFIDPHTTSWNPVDRVAAFFECP